MIESTSFKTITKVIHVHVVEPMVLQASTNNELIKLQSIGCVWVRENATLGS